jgi:hypothetical protein
MNFVLLNNGVAIMGLSSLMFSIPLISRINVGETRCGLPQLTTTTSGHAEACPYEFIVLRWHFLPFVN